MKAIQKKLLLASVTVGVLTPFFGGGAVAHAEEASNVTKTVTADNYEGGTINGSYSATEDTNDNNLTVSDLTVTGDSGDDRRVNAGFTNGTNANRNKVTINNVKNIGYLHGGLVRNWKYDNSSSASNNFIYIYNSEIYHIHGGDTRYGIANYNEVNMYSGSVTNLIGSGYAYTAGDANYNTLNIYGGTLSGTIQGGLVGHNAYTDKKNWGNGNAIGNKVNIYGGEISGNVYGGYVAKSGEVSNNEIHIYNNPTLSDAYLYAGYLGGNTDLYGSGNSLNIHTSGITAKNIGGFDTLNYELPDSVKNGDTILTLTDGTTNLQLTTVNVSTGVNSELTTDDKINLLYNENTINISEKTLENTEKVVLNKGATLTYDLDIGLSEDSKALVATVGNGAMTPIPMPPPPIPEPPPMPIEHFNFDDEGISGFFNDIDTDWTIFGDYGGGSMRYKVNNGYIDTTNQNLDLGAARKLGSSSSLMTIAPIFDHQNTNYDSYLNDGTHGRGNSKYTGGGFVIRNMNRNGFYYEGSFRAGKNKTDFASDNLDTTGNFGTITYDTSQTILNGHLKLGKYIRFDKNNLLNVYGFYYHTHQGGSSADLSSGEHYDFSSANAGRLRIGYRLTTRTSKISQVYMGLAYQYEYNSGVTANYKGYSTSGENHKGSSGMLELGWIIKPLKDNPWAVDINATGWIGNQRGVKAMAKIQKSF